MTWLPSIEVLNVPPMAPLMRGLGYIACTKLCILRKKYHFSQGLWTLNDQILMTWLSIIEVLSVPREIYEEMRRYEHMSLYLKCSYLRIVNR